MARTRTSDHTFRPRHAKRLVYASLLVLAFTGGLGAEGRALGAQPGQRAQGSGPGPGVPCVPCQLLSVTPAQVGALPAVLAGAAVLVRVAPGEPVARELTVLESRGARAGVHVVGIPAETDPTLASEASLLVIEAGAGDPGVPQPADAGPRRDLRRMSHAGGGDRRYRRRNR